MKPKATIMIPAYNAEKYLLDTLRSSTNQTYSGDYEILIVNDGSTDSTPNIANDFSGISDSNIRVLHQENKGISGARNRLLEESKGNILIGLDADDEIYPNSLEKVMDFYAKNPETGFVYTDRRCIDESGNIIYEEKKAGCHKFFDELIYFTHFPGHLRSFNKNKINGFSFDSSLTVGEDWDFLLQITPFVQKGYISEFLYDYRIHSNSISKIEPKKNRRDLSSELLKKHILKNNLYPEAQEIEVIRIEDDENIIYYNHLVDGKLNEMSVPAKKALMSYFDSYKNSLGGCLK